MKIALVVWIMSAALMAQSPLVEGKTDSPVRVLIYEDLQCPDCAVFRVMLDEKLLPKYGGKVAFEHREFPLPKHSWARQASIAARYFQSLDGRTAIQFRRETMKALRTIKAESFADWVKGFCLRNGLDAMKAVEALKDERIQALVEKEYQEGVARGIAKTPTVLVNGEPYIETFTFEEISKGIETALKEAGIQ